MADNTIIRIPTPRFGIREIVYFRESALLGYLEPAKVYRVRYDPDIGKTIYVFAYRKSSPNTQIAGDAIDLKNSKVISVVEDDVISYQEALAIKLDVLQKEITQTQSKIAENLGTPSIDVSGEDVTAPFDYGDISIGSMDTRTFSVINDGDYDLILSTDLVTIVGDSDFTIDAQPSQTISPNSNSEFVIRFAPTIVGRRVGVVQIASNDRTSPILSFTIEGNGSSI